MTAVRAEMTHAFRFDDVPNMRLKPLLLPVVGVFCDLLAASGCFCDEVWCCCCGPAPRDLFMLGELALMVILPDEDESFLLKLGLEAGAKSA